MSSQAHEYSDYQLSAHDGLNSYKGAATGAAAPRMVWTG